MEFEKKKAEEWKTERELSKYAELTGYHKRIVMMKEKYQSLLIHGAITQEEYELLIR